MSSGPNLGPSPDLGALPHDARGHVLIIAGAVTTSLALCAVCLRLYTRHFIIHQVGVDDWMALASLLSTIAMNVSQSINASRSLGHRIYDLDPMEVQHFFRLFWITEILYNVAMLFIKMTFLFQYYRIFRHVKAMRIVYITAMVAIGGWCFGQILAVVFTCVPPQAFWDRSIPARCQNEQAGVYLNAIGTLVTDFIILLLPLPSLWKLKLPMAQKLALNGIFSIGAFTSAISIVRLTTLHSGNDFTFAAVYSGCWSIAELSSGIIAAALATMRPLIGRIIPAFATRSARSYARYAEGVATFGSTKPSLNRLSMYGAKNKHRDTAAGSDFDLFNCRGFELQDFELKGAPPARRPSRSHGTTRAPDPSALSSDSESFNVAVEGETSPIKTPPALSRRNTTTQPWPLESPPGRGTNYHAEPWSGVQTQVTAGLHTLPRLSADMDDAARPRNGIRVDRDWKIQESTGSL
ncbi:hypothetical protein GGR56DRAFT_162060 [Xylariaceae sp. FL0804]|nr:hypothetical protein GGR56DRAFT_162060 [Xylariaceae sp. FL0804]